jgi:hypothetical protein
MIAQKAPAEPFHRAASAKIPAPARERKSSEVEGLSLKRIGAT